MVLPGTRRVLRVGIALDGIGATWCMGSPSFNQRDLLALLFSSAQHSVISSLLAQGLILQGTSQVLAHLCALETWSLPWMWL